MDILIKNMEMQKNCALCPFKDFSEHPFFNICVITGEENTDCVCSLTKASSCPLVALPEHGRLISDTALLHTLTHLKGATEHDTELLKEFEKMVRECTTIVEASK